MPVSKFIYTFFKMRRSNHWNKNIFHKFRYEVNKMKLLTDKNCSAVLDDYLLFQYSLFYESIYYHGKKGKLPVNVILLNGAFKRVLHGQRVKRISPIIKFQLNNNDEIEYGNLSTMKISDNPKVIGITGKLLKEDIELLKKFVRKNKKLLLMEWNLKCTFPLSLDFNNF